MSSKSSSNGFESASQIATRTGASLWAVKRAIAGLNIQPAAWFGTCRVFDAPGVRKIESKLKAVAEHRAARRRQPAPAEAATVTATAG